MRELYTIGHTLSYDGALSTPLGCTKLGFRPVSASYPEGYEGGWIWLTFEDANTFLRERFPVLFPDYEEGSFSVYVVQVTGPLGGPSEEDGAYRLMEDSPVICKAGRSV